LAILDQAYLINRITATSILNREKGKSMKEYLFALSLGFGLCILAANASAQPASCGERSKVVKKLVEKYGETRQSIGLGRNQGVIETYASLDTGTWTILITMPSGRTCLIAAGEGFENTTPIPENDSEDA
jgi:hypothetical protein